MATEVDICNLAIGFLGNTGRIASINPPEGSALAGWCKDFYPMARDALLNMRDFTFNTTWTTPAGMSVTGTQWQYCYALPKNTLTVVGVYPSEEDTSYPADFGYVRKHSQPYSLETASDGTVVIYTNVEDAQILRTIKVTDTSKFSPLAVIACARLLASYLAGPVIKGEAGTKESVNQLKIFYDLFKATVERDANQESDDVSLTYRSPSIMARL